MLPALCKQIQSLTSRFECFRRNGEVSPLTSSIVHVTLQLLGFLGNHPNWNACQKSEEWYIREVGKSDDRDESNDWNLKLGTGNSVYITSTELTRFASRACFTRVNKESSLHFSFFFFWSPFHPVIARGCVFNVLREAALEKFLTELMKYREIRFSLAWNYAEKTFGLYF